MRFYYSSKRDLYYEKAMTLYVEEGMCGRISARSNSKTTKNEVVVDKNESKILTLLEYLVLTLLIN